MKGLPGKKTIVFMVFVALFACFLPGPAHGWNKGVVTNRQIDSLYMEVFIKAFNGNLKVGEIFPVSKIAGNDVKARACLATIIGLNAPDEQVAKTGKTRDELLVMGNIQDPWEEIYSIHNALKTMTQEKWKEAIQKAQAAYNAPRVAPTFFVPYDSNGTKLKITLGQCDGMDYNNSCRFITFRGAPQDFTNPGLIAGRSVKDWIRKYTSIPSKAASKQLAPTYGPDFEAGHHNAFEDLCYNLCPYRGTVQTGAERFQWWLARLMNGSSIEEHYTSPFSNLDDQARHILGLTNSSGLYCAPGGYYRPPISCETVAPVLACLYGETEAYPFLARLLERYLDNNLTQGTHFWWESFYQLIAGWTCFKLLGDVHPANMTMADAAKKFDGTHYHHAYRYGNHRTPDKLVVVSWTARPKHWSIPQNSHAIEDLTEYQQNSFSTVTLDREGLPRNSNAEGDIDFNNLVTMISPEGEANKPDSEMFLTRPHRGMQGYFPIGSDIKSGAAWTTRDVACRFDRSEGVMSTAGSMRRATCENSVYFRRVNQYQSFTSFYGKTCISMVRALPGSDGLGGVTTWMDGFCNSFQGDANNDSLRLDCRYEGGTENLNLLCNATSFVKKSLTGAKWYSVNGRLGVATTGGRGNFIVKSGWGLTGNTEWLIPGALVSWDEPLNTSGTYLANMAAAYFVDASPEKVAYLQTTMAKLDDSLPLGWTGVVCETPEEQRVLAIARFYGDSANTRLRLSFSDGAPVFESLTRFAGGYGSTSFNFDTLESWGQTVAFYVKSGENIEAKQVGDCKMLVKGEGSITLAYLSKAESNRLFINGTSSLKTRSELKAGFPVALTGLWNTVRVENTLDSDYVGPGVEIIYPYYYSDAQTRLLGPDTNHDAALWQPERILIPRAGLSVKAKARDRSGVEWVDIYLDWVKVGRVTDVDDDNNYIMNLPFDLFTGDSIHSVHAVARDLLGNETKSFMVTFKGDLEGGVSVEHAFRNNGMVSPVSNSSSSYARNTLNREKTTPMSRNGSGGRLIANNPTALIESWVAQGRVQPKQKLSVEASGLQFQHKGNQYIFSLDGSKGRAVMLKKQGNCTVPVADAMAKIANGRWYDLKVRVSDGEIVGYLNDQKVLAVKAQ